MGEQTRTYIVCTGTYHDPTRLVRFGEFLLGARELLAWRLGLERARTHLACECIHDARAMPAPAWRRREDRELVNLAGLHLQCARRAPPPSRQARTARLTGPRECPARTRDTRRGVDTSQGGTRTRARRSDFSTPVSSRATITESRGGTPLETCSLTRLDESRGGRTTCGTNCDVSRTSRCGIAICVAHPPEANSGRPKRRSLS